MSIRILDIGQCGFDGPRMARLWRSQLNATVIQCDDAPAAAQLLAEGRYDIILVNRILAVTGGSGLDVIKSLLPSTTQTKTPIMLVSDLPDAQAAAIALGALPGFGKAALADQSTLDLVQKAASKK
jgi:DNA-binding response OmpR family regulator